MYSPQYAIETDRSRIDTVIRENPFATIVFIDQGKSQSFHLPLFLENNSLIGHLALANPSWKDIDQQEVLVIIHGPHSYISPTWYGNPDNVPTWNYISIQIRGKVILHRDELFLRKALSGLSEKYDPNFDIQKNIDDHLSLLKAIVGISIDIQEVFAKFKLAQSKPETERLGVIAHLEKSRDSMDHEVARAMRETKGT